jgi:hypothetical protein
MSSGWSMSAGLEVVLLKRTYVLPWNQFLYAELTTMRIRLAFMTHDVMVSSAGLDSLLMDLAAQRIARLQQPARVDRFTGETGESRRGLMRYSVFRFSALYPYAVRTLS